MSELGSDQGQDPGAAAGTKPSRIKLREHPSWSGGSAGNSETALKPFPRAPKDSELGICPKCHLKNPVWCISTKTREINSLLTQGAAQRGRSNIPKSQWDTRFWDQGWGWAQPFPARTSRAESGILRQRCRRNFGFPAQFYQKKFLHFWDFGDNQDSQSWELNPWVFSRASVHTLRK